MSSAKRKAVKNIDNTTSTEMLNSDRLVQLRDYVPSNFSLTNQKPSIF